MLAGFWAQAEPGQRCCSLGKEGYGQGPRNVLYTVRV